MSDDGDLCLIEKCLGPVDRVVIWTGRAMFDDMPEEQWPIIFIVDYIKEGDDGFTVGVWDGNSYDEAMQVARGHSRDFGGVPIVDRTNGGTVL